MNPCCIVKLLILVVVLSLCHGKCTLSCVEKMRSAGIIQKNETVGTTNISIVYGDKKRVKCGNQLGQLDVWKKPKITFDATKNCSLVTIMFFDPSVPFFKPYLHWMSVNVPTDVLKCGFSGQANDLYPYINPLVPGDTNVFFLYCQSRCITNNDTQIERFFKRIKFEPADFASENGLTGVIAANFFHLPKLF